MISYTLNNENRIVPDTGNERTPRFFDEKELFSNNPALSQIDLGNLPRISIEKRNPEDVDPEIVINEQVDLLNSLLRDPNSYSEEEVKFAREAIGTSDYVNFIIKSLKPADSFDYGEIWRLMGVFFADVEVVEVGAKQMTEKFERKGLIFKGPIAYFKVIRDEKENEYKIVLKILYTRSPKKYFVRPVIHAIANESEL